MADDILIVDDEADIRELVSGILQDEGFITRSARDSDDALAHVASRRPNLVFLDIWLQGSRLDGLQLLDAMKAQHPELPIVMISGHGNIETAVAAIKQGAYDFIEKPFKADRLVLVTQRALETATQARGEGAQAVGALDTGRQVVLDEPAAPNGRKNFSHQQPHFDCWARGRRQGTYGARDPQPFDPRQWSVHRDQCGGDDAGADGDRAVRRGT